ncbi:MAG: hypothetical protein ACLQIQ_04020 [Beijerinckiaceae bacterium]
MALLKAFNPHELSADLVLGVATGREDQLSKILATIRANIDAPIKQHVIVSAPRGYGKSFFLRLVEVKIAELAAKEGLPVAMALLPEELPHVKEPETLIAEITRSFLRAPADTISVRWTEDDGESWNEAIADLESALDDRFGKGPGLLVAGVENFDLLVRKAFGASVQSGRLREFLTRRGSRVMLLAASARGAFDRNYDERLFKAFDEIVIERWSIEQCLDFFEAQRAAASKPPLDDVQRAKARAVATFIGGTPRLATLIGEALLEQDPLRAADLLERLVDELTPYYKERIEVLPSRSQKLLDALLRGGEKCSATVLAERVQARGQAAIAAPLDDLKKDLIVFGEKAPDSAEVLLGVSDRVFAHYYRKRILSHGQATCPLEALVELLAVFYSPEEKKREAEKFSALGLVREAAVMQRLLSEDHGERLEAQSLSERNTQREPYEEWFSDMDRMWHEGRYEEALDIARGAAARAEAAGDVGDQAEALQFVAFSLGALKRYEGAIATAHEVAAKAEAAGDMHTHATALGFVAFSLGALNRHEEVIATAREAAAKAQAAGDIDGQATALRRAAFSLGRLNRHEEAIATARKAAAKAEWAGNMGEQATALRHAASSLGELGRHEEAIATARKAAAKAEAAGDIRGQAEALLLAALNLGRLDRHEEAIATAREAAAKAEAAGNIDEQAMALRNVAWSFGRLNRHEEAINTAREAAAKAEAAGDIDEQAIALQLAAFSLVKLDRLEEATAALREAETKAEASSNANVRGLIGQLVLLVDPHIDAGLALRAFGLIIRDASIAQPSRYFERVSHLVTKEMAWPELISLLQQVPEIAVEISGDAELCAVPGKVIVGSIEAKDYELARAQARHLVATLSLAIAECGDRRLAQLWTALLDATARQIATGVDDPTILAELAEIFAAHSGVPMQNVTLLRAAAAYHSGKRDPAMLARLDPDLATTLMAVFPPPGAPAKRRRKPVAKKNASKTSV